MILSVFTLIYFSSLSADIQPITKSKGALVITHNFLIKNFIQGELSLFNKELHFKPLNNTHIIKEIIIPLNKIDTIYYRKISTSNIVIKCSTGEIFKFGIRKKKLFFPLLKNAFALEKNKDKIKPKENKPLNVLFKNDIKTNLIIYTWGSLGLNPLYIKGVLELKKERELMQYEIDSKKEE